MARDIYPTQHLVSKLQSREITWGEIVDTVNNPEVIYGPDERGRRTMQKGDICAVVAENGAVITALLRSTEQWTDDEAKKRSR